MKNLKIVDVSYGIASRYKNLIEINRKLKGSLRNDIIKHELSHSSGKYTKKDFKIDFQSKKPYFLKTLIFGIRNPEALIGWFPIMYSYHLKMWTFNITSLFPIILYSCIFAFVAWLFLNINILNSLAFFFNVTVFMNVFLLFYTHIYVKFTKI